ncbi:MAG: hypothetical protein KY468_11610 [Armatimonadetes bacterium]|nr:hypothetical protein [Armatimonadota bacterium]
MFNFQRILFWGAAACMTAALGTGPALAQDEELDLRSASGTVWKLKSVPKDDKSALDLYKSKTYVPDDTWVDETVPGQPILDPADNTSFYYRTEFTIPATFPKNRPTFLRGFQIDDRDETYLNGTLIGTGSTWNQQRVYFIPEGVLDYNGKNVLLIFGTDDTGGHGMSESASMGGPLLETIGNTEGWLKIEAKDASDRPAPNVPFTVTQDVDGTPTEVEMTTDSSGTAWFRDLPPGTFPVKVTQYPWTGNLTPNGTLNQTITAGQLTTLVIQQQPFIYQVLKAASPITIDGQKEAAWDKAMVMEINNERQVVSGKPNWTGLADHSARARWMYDDTYIYLFAEVTDDERNNIQVENEDHSSWGNSWQGDGFETYLQLDPYTPSRSDYLTDKNYQWTFGINAENKVSWKIFRDVVGDVTPFGTGATIPLPGDNAKVISTTAPKGYILEARFKWTDLPDVNAQFIPPKVGTGGAIGLAVNDSDTAGSQRESQIMWNAKDDLWTNPANFVRAVWAGTDLMDLRAPTAPTGVTATSTGNSVTLTWNAVPGATGYKVRRSSNPNGPFLGFIRGTGTTPLTTTTLTEPNLTIGNNYYYVVVATNVVGDSPNSAVAAVTVGGGAPCTLGDVVGTEAGAVDVTDAVALLSHIVNTVPITDPARLRAANADKTGGVDIGDAVTVLRIVVGLQAKESCP